MNLKLKTFSYAQLNTFLHRLSGVTKLICFLLLTSAVMFTYDIRVILSIMVMSLILMKIAKIRFSQVRIMYIYVFIFLIAKFCKYLSVIPLGIIFVLTTNPSEFASSLNGIGISYKVGTALSLTLRYFPDVAGDYETIKMAQEARGLDMSRKASMGSRLKNSSAILSPLIMTTMDRIDLISNAMDLRGFGKHKKRTWYVRKPLTKEDYLSIVISALVLFGALYVRFFINHSYFYNPFIK